MKIVRNAEVPTNIGRAKLGKTSMAMMEFIESDDVNIKFECESKKEAGACYSTLFGTAKRYGLPVRITRSFNDIYVIRKETK